MRARKREGFSWAVTLSAVLLWLIWPAAVWGAQKERLTLKGTWVFTAKEAPFSLGMDKGFFAAEGIDLDLQDGRGSVANIQLLAAKQLLASLADSSVAAKFISQGAPVKVAWGYLQTSPNSIIAHEDLGIRSPKDLEGKKLGAPPASSVTALFPAVAERVGVNLSRVQFVNVTPAAANTSLLNRNVDAIVVFFPDNVPFLRSRGAKVNFLRYADFGVNTLGEGISVHKSVLSEKPDLLRRLLRAVGKSVQYATAHREEAIASMKKRAPLSIKDPKVALEVLDGFLSLLHTKNNRGKPLGWMAREDWKETIEILTKYGGLKDPLPPEEYYTNDFIHKAAM